jgi:hypothetical protein
MTEKAAKLLQDPNEVPPQQRVAAILELIAADRQKLASGCRDAHTLAGLVKGGAAAALLAEARHAEIFRLIRRNAKVVQAIEELKREAGRIQLETNTAGSAAELLPLAASPDPEVRGQAEARLASLLDRNPSSVALLVDRAFAAPPAEQAAAVKAVHAWSAGRLKARRFFRLDARPQLLEILRAPETSIYGGLPTIWLCRDGSGALRRVMLTGHAYASICSTLSGIFSHAFLELPLKASSFLLAGAIRCDLDDSPESHEQLQRRLEVHDVRFRAAVASLLPELVAPGTGETDELAAFELHAELTRMGLKRPGAILAQIMDRLLRAVSDLGLARLRELDFETHEAEEAELRRATAAARPPELSADGGSRPLLVPLLHPQTRAPIEVEIPSHIFNTAALEKIARQYLRVRQQRIAEEGARRRRFYRECIDSFCRAYRRYSTLRRQEPSKFEEERVEIHEIVDLETATTTKLPTPNRERADRYLAGLPASIVQAVWWKVQMDELLADKGKQPGELHLAPCVFDALIRGWQLPFSDGVLEEHRQAWEEACRPGTLLLLEDALKRGGLELGALVKEQTIFLATSDDPKRLVLRPHYLFDPSVAGPDDAYASLWQQRRLTLAEAATARRLAVERAEQGDWEGALAVDDGTLVDGLCETWQGLLASADPNAEEQAVSAYLAMEEDPVDEMQDRFGNCANDAQAEAFLEGPLHTAIHEHPGLPELRWLRVGYFTRRLEPFLHDAMALGQLAMPDDLGPGDSFWLLVARAQDPEFRVADLLRTWSAAPEANAPLRDELVRRPERYRRAAELFDEDLHQLWQRHRDYVRACLERKHLQVSAGRAAGSERLHGEERARLLWGAAVVLERQARALEKSLRLLETQDEAAPKAVEKSLAAQAAASKGGRWRQLRDLLRDFDRGALPPGGKQLHARLLDLREDILEDAEAYATHAALGCTEHQEARICLARLRWLRGHYRRALTGASLLPSAEVSPGRLGYPLAFAVTLAGGTVETATPVHPCTALEVSLPEASCLTVRSQDSGEPLVRISGLDEHYQAQLCAALTLTTALTFSSSEQVRKEPLAAALTIPVPAPPRLARLEALLASDAAIASAVYFGVPHLRDPRELPAPVTAPAVVAIAVPTSSRPGGPDEPSAR